jgi:putative Mn2+ efflux pump MntP
MKWVDVIRIFCAVAAGFDMLLLPRALDALNRSSRLTLLVLGFDVIMLSVIGQLIGRLHQDVVYYGLPLVGPGVILIAFYIIRALWAQHQGRYQ